MDTTQTTTLRQAQTASRDVGAHRKAYLDTYAKRRAGITAEAEAAMVTPAPVQAATQPQQDTFVPTVQPAVVAVPVAQPQSLQVEEQPFTYRQTASAQPQQQTANTGTRKAYLDSLMYKNVQRVAADPAALDTPVQPQLTETTQHLIDTQADDRISANLSALYNSKPLTDHITRNKTSASAAHVRTIVASALTCGMLAVGIFAFTSRYDAQPVVAQPIGSPVIEVEAPVNNTPTGAPIVAKNDNAVPANPSDPVRIIASSVGINARVDGLGTTPDGLIAVPQSYTTVGWYNKGATPGAAGPAVLVGHYTGGNGGVFDKLGSLNDGDLITMKNGKNEVFTYRVTKKTEYPKEQVPMAEIFKKGDASRLEIITCSGKWQSKAYNNRLVVTAELVK